MTFGQPCVSTRKRQRKWAVLTGYVRTFIRRTISGIVAALNACAGASWLNEFDVMLVSQALAALRIALAARPATGVVLTSGVVRVQSTEMAWSDAAGHFVSV